MAVVHWSEAVRLCHQKGEPYALITILGCSGSTPRDQASKMVITRDCSYDSIGGGQLEFSVMQTAREKLRHNETAADIVPFPLGGAVGQCCGGNVTVLIETFAACDFHVALFGAGHVAQSLIKILGELPCRVTWIDNRKAFLTDKLFGALPANVSIHHSDHPVDVVATLPNNTDVLVMTHDHSLDYALIVAALGRNTVVENTFTYIGLIGSSTKAERFRARLHDDGFSTQSLLPLYCPVGLSTVPGKKPMAVAVSIAGQLLARHQESDAPPQQRGLAWRDIKKTLRVSAKGAPTKGEARKTESEKYTHSE